MPAFEYTALNTKGQEQRGVLEGESARSIRQLLRDQNLTPISVTETKQAAKSRAKRSFSFGARVGAKDLSILTRQLSTLTRSGAPLEEGLSTVAKQTAKNHVKGVILDVRSKVLEGHSLASALQEHPNVFPDLYRATVSAGEQSGHLDLVLERLADYTEARQEMGQKVGGALAYPIILSIVALLVVVGLLTYIVPQVVQVFTDLGRDLPLLTRVMIGLSDITKQYGVLIAIGIAAGIFVFTRLLRQPAFRLRFDLYLLRLPVAGYLVQGVNTARFARTLSILAASGVPILDALSIAAEVVRNVPMRKAVEAAAVRVREGSSIYQALEASALFPPMAIHLIASGESSGKLEEMLERTAIYQERETSATITTMVNLFEHFMILIMGFVVLMIVLAVLLPIFEINQMVQ